MSFINPKIKIKVLSKKGRKKKNSLFSLYLTRFLSLNSKKIQGLESSGFVLGIFPKKTLQKNSLHLREIFPTTTKNYFLKKFSLKKIQQKIFFQRLCPQKRFLISLHHLSSSKEKIPHKISQNLRNTKKSNCIFQKFFRGLGQLPGFSEFRILDPEKISDQRFFLQFIENYNFSKMIDFRYLNL